ncbi:MAG: nuclear transport factor 2 family protein [Isosphaeraceae bacterium]
MPLLETARKFFDALNAHEMETVASMIAPTGQVHTPIGSFTGGRAFSDWMVNQFRAIPDFTHEVRGLSAEQGDTIAFELHAFGTFSGPLSLGGADIAPTNRKIDVSAVDFWRFENGLIAEYHLYFDRMDFFGQLGINPPSA